MQLKLDLNNPVFQEKHQIRTTMPALAIHPGTTV
jgi:hypothetical protein